MPYIAGLLLRFVSSFLVVEMMLIYQDSETSITDIELPRHNISPGASTKAWSETDMSVTFTVYSSISYSPELFRRVWQELLKSMH